jgi:phosphatidylglycerophosphatase A
MAEVTRRPALARIVASGFGIGYAPFAPGTFGSLLGLAIGAALLTASPEWLPLGILTAIVAGYAAIRVADAEDDPGWVVIDEVAGQMIALLPLARASLAGLTAAFLLFRLFDIAKPGPVGWLDRRHDALGVMADDLAAGALAAIVIWAALAVLTKNAS